MYFSSRKIIEKGKNDIYEIAVNDRGIKFGNKIKHNSE
jgi:hypothetical protein